MVEGFYLKQLLIQNFATFKNQKIPFQPGLNAIVGETGSGKSLVLDALELILGGRADKKVVRRNTDYALIEADFKLTDREVIQFLESQGYPVEGEDLIIKRLIYKNGTTRNYINHQSCNVSFLATFSKKFIDLVGQFENQKLLSDSYQLYLLDHFSKQGALVEEFQRKLGHYKSLVSKENLLLQSKDQREQRIDYLDFQITEIEKLNPSVQDEEELQRKKRLLISLEKQQKLSFQLSEVFQGADSGAGLSGHVKMLSHLILKNPDLFHEEVPYLSEIEDRLFALESMMQQKLSIDVNPHEIELIISRLDSYQKLKRKFGGTVESILQTRTDFEAEKSQLESMDFSLTSLKKEIDLVSADLNLMAQNLHQQRSLYAKKLAKELTEKIRALKMNGATIKIELHKLEELTETGHTKAFFTAETNPGEGHFKIKDIASGGELSRILLAIRQILSAHDSISIFLFDEIDTGIGGETASCIGKALSEVAMGGQVIAITHLPQIAQFAESLLVVQKEICENNNESRTESSIKEVTGKMVMKEVRAMAQLH
jgi:DNA repair protein RecN (Recombination protein N)